MYFYSSVKILLFFVFEFEKIFGAQAIILENDITKPMDKWFVSIFTLNANETIEMFGGKLLRNFNTGMKLFHVLEMDKQNESRGALDFKFSTDILRLSHANIALRMWEKFSTENDTSTKAFVVDVVIENFTISAVSSAGQPLQLVSTNSSWDRFTTKIKKTSLGWGTSSEPVTKIEEEELRRDIPALLGEHLGNISTLGEIQNVVFQRLIKPRNELLSIHPNLFEHTTGFHYLIPKVPFFRFILKRIVIANLSNLDSFRIQPSGDFITHTLLVKDIEGSMTLDYTTENEAPLKMNFMIDDLYVMKKQNTNCVLVQAECWQIVRAKSNVTLSRRQSQVLIRGLEFAIASSILPSMKVGKVCSIDTPVEAIKIANVTDWETVKKSYKGLIPFNDDVYDDSAIDP